MEIILAKDAGFCFGVKRAINLALNAANQIQNIYTLGPIIHNPQVVKKLADYGIKETENIDHIESGTIIFRSHGVSPKIYQKADEKGLKIIDATCPNVAKVQKIALQLQKKGYTLVVIGEKEHPEVKSILDTVNENAYCISSIKEISKISPEIDKLGIVAQTTQTLDNFRKIISKLVSCFKELCIFNTICNATLSRQKFSLQLAKKVDTMVVIGGYNSANTRRLTNICKKVNKNTHQVEEASELKINWIKDANIVGITAGASTPSWIIEEIIDNLKSMKK
ncbi:MAG: 4-hydroxy-3-methylbut-2-enyl diphosphate reductase [bacterium]|nr:4-hydroxy-3-methylbut-2-enyl diphosphate reductase [bacterium]